MRQYRCFGCLFEGERTFVVSKYLALLCVWLDALEE